MSELVDLSLKLESKRREAENDSDTCRAQVLSDVLLTVYEEMELRDPHYAGIAAFLNGGK